MFRRLDPDIRDLMIHAPPDLRDTLISDFTAAYIAEDMADGGEARAMAKALANTEANAGVYTPPLFVSA
jgi:hypothetical protein